MNYQVRYNKPLGIWELVRAKDNVIICMSQSKNTVQNSCNALNKDKEMK